MKSYQTISGFCQLQKHSTRSFHPASNSEEIVKCDGPPLQPVKYTDEGPCSYHHHHRTVYYLDKNTTPETTTTSSHSTFLPIILSPLSQKLLAVIFAHPRLVYLPKKQWMMMVATAGGKMMQNFFSLPVWYSLSSVGDAAASFLPNQEPLPFLKRLVPLSKQVCMYVLYKQQIGST